MTISIALATCNGEKYLADQLASLAGQTLLPDELVVSDDASVDGTLGILEEFASSAPFAVNIHVNRHNRGYRQNFGQVLALCKGDTVFLCDQDDIWLPSKLQVVDDFFAQHPDALLVVHDLTICRSDLSPVGQSKIERMEGLFNLTDDYVVGMASAIRRELLQLCLPIPEADDVTHDNWLHRCAAAIGGKRILREELALYRRHAASVTAEGDLNVDFVTDAAHFGRESGWKNFLTRHPTPDTADRKVVDWLQSYRAELINKGLATGSAIDSYLEKQADIASAEAARRSLLEYSRLFRLPAVLRLYRRGGYTAFNGWKSALKDLVVR